MQEEKLTKDFISSTRHLAPLSEVFLLTNGLLIPSMKSDFWETLVNNNVILNITAYPPTISIMPKILDILDTHGVKYFYRKAIVFGKRSSLEPNSDAALNAVHCGSAGCHYMRDGYVFKCPDASLIKYMYSFIGADLKNDRGLSLKEAEENPQEFLKKLIEPTDLCRFCSNKVQSFFWEPTKGLPEVKDWLI